MTDLPAEVRAAADRVEADVHTALEAMYGSDGATDLMGDWRNTVEAALRQQLADEIDARRVLGLPRITGDSRRRSSGAG